MRSRPLGFINDEFIAHHSEQFEYIQELHEYLWRFIRVEFPGACGSLCNYVDTAVEKAEQRRDE